MCDLRFKAKQSNTTEKFVSADKGAKIEKREANVPPSEAMGLSPGFLAPRQPSVCFSTGPAEGEGHVFPLCASVSDRD